MLRKLTLLICLISFSPVAVGAQQLVAVAESQAAAGRATEQQLPARELNLSPPVEKVAAVFVSPGGNQNQSAPDQMSEPQKKERKGLTWSEWREIHWGGNRWLWWAGATVALIALHVAVGKDD